ncbi:MAG TPA: ANTAR domain-containing protein [Trebonia sp.]|nr:ANTAR domain-containing protein [Trebonia sp.]
MASGRTYWRAVRLTAQLQEAVATRGIIEQATGILMAEHNCSPSRARHLLATTAQRNRLSVQEVAADLVRRASSSRRGDLPEPL